MRAVRTLTICFSLMILLSSCKLWNNLFAPKYGCKTNGKNIGAEKLASGDPAAIKAAKPAAIKAAKKAKKFKA